MNDIVLNDQQLNAVNQGEIWWNNKAKQVFEISGPAGSGKTTIIYALRERLKLNMADVIFVAYVGKATLELSRKGNNAHTIHSTIYDLQEVPVLDEVGLPVMVNGRPKTKPSFVKKLELPSNIKLIVLDEAGMVNKEIARDLLSFNIPIIALGDLDQLPPVFGDSYFLVRPDIVLTEIMRQAKGDPIIQLSQMAKKGIYIAPGKYGERCHVVLKEQITDDIMASADIIICGKNTTRDTLNNHIRHNILRRPADRLCVGDKIICRQNNWKLSIDSNLYLINGMNGYIDNIYLDSYDGRTINIDFRPEFLQDEVFRNIKIDYKYLFMNIQQRKDSGRSYHNRFEFGHVITTHLSQGSQYNKVLLFNERMGDREYYRKWLYTAITRAKTHLIIAL